MAIYYNGVMVTSAGSGGVDIVTTLPSDTAADEDILYIRETDTTLWLVVDVTVAAVAFSVTHAEINVPSGYTWQDVASTDPSVSVASYYFNDTNNIFRTKEAGAIDDVVTNTDLATVASGYTWLGVASTAPTNAAQAFYFDDSDNRFYSKTAGNDASTVTTSTFAPQGVTTQIGDWLGAFENDTDAAASLNYDVTHRQSYYQIQFNNFRQHAPNSATWFTVSSNVVFGVGQYRLLNPDAIDTEAELIAELDTTYNSARNYVYYDATDDELKDLDSYTRGDIWVVTTFQDVVDDSDAVYFGQFGLSGTTAINTSAEVLAWFQDNAYDSSVTYAFHNSDDSKIQTSVFTEGVPWEDSTLAAASGDSSAVWIGNDVNTDSEIEAYFDDDDNDYDSVITYYFRQSSPNEIHGITAYTEAVPEHEVPELQQITSTGGTGLNQTQVDARVRAIGLIDSLFTVVSSQTELNAVDTSNAVSLTKVDTAFGSYIVNDLLFYDTDADSWEKIGNLSGEILSSSTDVTTQDELDAITTDGTIALAKVTTAFGTYSVNDLLFYDHGDDAWEVVSSGSASDDYAVNGTVNDDGDTLTITLSSGSTFDVDLTNVMASGTSPYKGAYSATTTYGLGNYVSRAGNGLFLSIIGSNTGNTPEDSPDEWRRMGVPSIVSQAVAEGGANALIFSWTSTRVRQAIIAVVVSWARIGNTDIIPRDKVPDVQTSATEVTDQDELDAITTADTVAVAKVTTAFSTYSVNDVLFYDHEDSAWEVIFSGSGSGGGSSYSGVTATDVASQDNLDAITTADTSAFARVTTAFSTYNVGDLLVYDEGDDTWELLISTEARIRNRIPFTFQIEKRFLDSLSGSSGNNRWITALNALSTAYLTRIYGTTALTGYLTNLKSGDTLRVMYNDEEINTLTLTADAGSVDSGSVLLTGTWRITTPSFTDERDYEIFFSRSPAIGGNDGVIDDITLSGTTITISRTVGDDLTLDIADALDGVVTDATISESYLLTLTVTGGDDVTLDLSSLAGEAPIHYSSEIESLVYVATLDGSEEQFTLTPVTGNQYDLTFSGLPDSDRRLTEDVLQGSVLGFYNGDTEVVLADVDENYNSTDGIRLTFESAVTFSLTITYTIKITQARRGADSTASGTEATRTRILDTTTALGGLTRVLFTLSEDLDTFDEASDLQFILWDGTLASPFHPIPISLLTGLTRQASNPTGVSNSVVVRGGRLGQLSAVTAFADSNLYVSIQDGTHLWISGSGSGGTLLEPDRMELYVAPRIGGEAQVDASEQIRERLPFPHSFELRYVDSNTGEGSNNRWTTALVSNVRNIGIRPPDSQSDFVETIESADQMQVRNEDGTYNNTYTFSSDVIPPDTEGYFASITGSWETTPDFTDETTYMLFFSRSPDVVNPSQLDLKLNTNFDNVPSSVATDSQQSFQVRLHLPVQIDGDDITGDIDAIELNINDFPSDYQLGQVFHFTPDFASGNNTGNVTLQVNTNSTIALLRNDGSQIPAGELIDGIPIFATYDDINDAFRADIDPPQDIPDVVGGTGASTETNSDGDVVVSVDNPFSEDDESRLDDLAGRVDSHPEDDLLFHQAIGSQHFFDQRREVHGIDFFDDVLYLLDDEGRANDERIYTTGSDVYGAARNSLHWYFGHGDNVQIYQLQSGSWVSSASRGTGVTNIRGIEMTIDVDNPTSMYILAEGTSTQMRVRHYDVSETANTLTQRTSHNLLLTDINPIITGAGLEALTEMYDSDTNRGVSAISAKDDALYLAVNGIGISGTQIPVSAILKIDTTGTGDSRVYTLDTDFIQVLHISDDIRGLEAKENGYWIGENYSVSDYREVDVEGGNSEVSSLSFADDTVTLGRHSGTNLTADISSVRIPQIQVFYGNTQTGRTEPFVDLDSINGLAFFTFNATADETEGNPTTSDVDILSASDASDADTLSDGATPTENTLSIADNQAFALTAGLWNIYIEGLTQTSTNDDFVCQLYQIQSGTDDLFLTDGSYILDTETIDRHGSISLSWKWLRLSATAQFKIGFRGLTDNDDEDNFAGCVILERFI